MKKYLVIALAAMMILSGCGKKNDTADKSAASATAATQTATEGFSVGDVKVSKDIVKYFEDLASNGQAATDQTKSQAKTQAQQLATFIAIGENMKIDIKKEYEEFLKTIEEQQGVTIDEFKKNQGISDEIFEFICKGSVYQQKLIEECKKENGIDDKATEKFFKENFLRAKHVLLQTQGKTDEEKAEIKKKIDDLYAQAKAGADFDKMIEEYNEDPGMKQQPEGYVFTEGEMVKEFEQGVKDIKNGEYNLVETSYGYHIVKRLALDETPELYKKFYEESTDKINQAMLNDKMNDFISKKTEEYKLEVK